MVQFNNKNVLQTSLFVARQLKVFVMDFSSDEVMMIKILLSEDMNLQVIA